MQLASSTQRILLIAASSQPAPDSWLMKQLLRTKLEPLLVDASTLQEGLDQQGPPASAGDVAGATGTAALQVSSMICPR